MPHFGALLSSTAKLPDGVSVAVGASPFAYVMPANGTYIVGSGTLSAMSYTRNGASIGFGSNSRVVAVRRGDTITVTYSVAPTIVFLADGT